MPIMASSLLSSFYCLQYYGYGLDWHAGGQDAVAGVGVGGMYSWLSQGLSVRRPRMGGQVHVAQSIGRNDTEKARKYAQAALQTGVCIRTSVRSGARTVYRLRWWACLCISDPVTVGYAKIYMKITCGMIVFSYINYTMTGLFTAQGDSNAAEIKWDRSHCQYGHGSGIDHGDRSIPAPGGRRCGSPNCHSAGCGDVCTHH